MDGTVVTHARRGGARSVLLAVVAGVLALAGCAVPPAEQDASGPELVRHGSASELLSAVAARIRGDGTAGIRLGGNIQGAAGPEGDSGTQIGGEGVLRIGLDGAVTVEYTQSLTRAGQTYLSRAAVVDTVVYVQQPDLQGTMQGWTRVDRSSASSEQLTLATLAANVVDNADPTANPARYAEAALIADAVGVTVDGTPAVRYQIVVDLNRAVELATDPQARSELQAQLDAGLTRISSTLWVDAQDRPLRSESRHGLPGIGTLTLTIGYRDWGRPVGFTAPAS